MANISAIKLPNGTTYNLKDTEAQNNKMPIVTFGEPVVLIDTTTVSFSKDGDNDWYISAENPINGFTKNDFQENTLYKIEWDGIEYKEFYRMYHKYSNNGYYDWGAIGCAIPLGYFSTQMPFLLSYDYYRNSGEVQFFSYDTQTTHTVKITKIPYVKTIVDENYYLKTSIGLPAIRPGSGSFSAIQGAAKDASGSNSHAEGVVTLASGASSHAEGVNTVASNLASHAEGMNTTASGSISHAEGRDTTASFSYAHAEGQRTTASGQASHAEGQYTIANHAMQNVFGTYNVADSSSNAANQKGDYIEIVGNGTAEEARSNARTLDWNGNEWLAGKLTVGANPTAAMDVVTKQYMENQGYAQLSGASFTGSVSFGDSVFIDEATIGDLVINGAASFTNNIQVNTLNGVTVGNSPKFTDTVLSIHINETDQKQLDFDLI